MYNYLNEIRNIMMGMDILNKCISKLILHFEWSK